ncbi:MAG: hypothetical protein EXS23_01550 [Pedosphaera sp.]|nr:hypothetical protein [Pedosphaera sp.]
MPQPKTAAVCVAMTRRISAYLLLSWLLIAQEWRLGAADSRIHLTLEGGNVSAQVQGDEDEEWRFQTSDNLVIWTNAPSLGSVFGGISNLKKVPISLGIPAQRFLRTTKTDGLFDVHLFRKVSLTFTNSNWATLLANARTSGGNVRGVVTLANGVILTNIGARYKGNSSYDLGGSKKSVNLDINIYDPEARVMGYRAINFNNAAGDFTLIREPLYFNVMREYTPCPHGAMAMLWINGTYWGVYSMVDQINNDLLDDWFSSHEGDRWRAPNIGGGVGGGGGGGGGGFASAASAFSYLGPTPASYSNNYELKSDLTTNAWPRLVNAINVLNNTPVGERWDKVESVFAVDRWLWFLAVENLFVDDDSYWNKGADYAFYYEPESGRIHPVEHDGNEAFTSTMGITSSLSPVQGAAGTNRPLLSKLLPIPELRQRYIAHMRTVLEERFNPTYLTPVINHYHRLTVADIITDPKKNFTMTAYTNALVALRTYVTNRYKFLTNHVELRPLPPQIVAVHPPSSSPMPNEAPYITAKIAPVGTNGISSAWLYWRDKPYGRFSKTLMLDDGAHQDAAANDGLFGGVTTNYSAGNKIHYYVEARSANPAKAATFSPARAEQQTYTYRVALATATNTVVVINELMADNEKTLTDPQGEFDDWIELRNLTDQEIDLSGCYLTDEPNNPRKWPFPAHTTIAAGGYLLVWADEDGLAAPGLHSNFKLEKAGEQIFLIDTDANLNAVLDTLTYTAQKADRSVGRSPSNADQFILMEPTPGQPNAGF